MRGDLPEWALRLSSELPSRRHEQRSSYGTETRGGDTTGLAKREDRRGWNGGANKRAVVIEGEQYESIREAAAVLEKNQTTIQRMLRRGRAKYAGD